MKLAVNKKTKKASAQKPRNRKQLVVILLLVTLVVATVVGAVAYSNHQTNQRKAEQAFQADKARFAQLEADMQTAKERGITIGVGSIPSGLRKSCGYTSVKYSQGTLYCTVGFYFEYESMNKSEISNNVQRIKKNIEEIEGFGKGEEIQLGGNDKYLYRFFREDGINCDLGFTFSTVTNNILSQPTISFTCNDVVAKPVYTLAE